MRRVSGIVLVAALAFPALAQAGAVHLRIRATDGAGHVRTGSVTCDSSGPRTTGYLRRRNATKVCRRAYALERFLSRPATPGGPCTMVYGGPDRARISGFVRGSDVDRRFSLRNGCEIADWKRAQLLLPKPVGA